MAQSTGTHDDYSRQLFTPSYQNILPYIYMMEFDTLSKATAESGDSDSFEFDVRPKRRQFQTSQEKRRYIEEYTRKKKTELCKNFQLTGFCRFGDTCSFAHGEDQLQPKNHLHEKYKTKPCKRYHKQGFCCYGNRCQYTHDELRDSRKSVDIKYIKDIYIKAGIPLQKNPCINRIQPQFFLLFLFFFYLQIIEQLKKNIRYDIQRFWCVKDKIVQDQPEILIKQNKRLNIFQQITDEYINLLSPRIMSQNSSNSKNSD